MIDGAVLTVYFGDAHTTGHDLTSEVLLDHLADSGVERAVLVRGSHGFGVDRRIESEAAPDASTDLPLVALAFSARLRFDALIAHLPDIVPRGLVTIEPASLEPTGVDFADAHGAASAKLTVLVARGDVVTGQAAHRAVVDALRTAGAPGATAFLGVDGLVDGIRRPARMFSRNRAVPMLIDAVGPRRALRAAIRTLGGRLPHAVLILRDSTILKHDGDAVQALPAHGADDCWQAVEVYTRQIARVGGRPLYLHLTDMLREARAAGATTMRGEWGYSSDEAPHGDRFGRLRSHTPTCTVVVDRPSTIRRVWPRIDQATMHFGLVTSRFLPGYHELG